MSLFGAKWSITSEILSLSKTLLNLAFLKAFIATGVVISLPSTISSFAIMSWFGSTRGKPHLSAKIFCDIVILICCPFCFLNFAL